VGLWVFTGLSAWWAPATHAADPEPSADAAVFSALGRWDLKEAEALLASLEGLDPDKRTRATAELAFRRSDFAGALKSLRPYVAEHPADHEARVLLGRTLYALGDNKAAFKALDHLAEDYNADRLVDSQALTQLGIALHLNGYFKSANRAFGEAVKAGPRDTAARIAWAELFDSKYNHAEAFRLLDEIEQLAPGVDNPEMAVLRARIRLDGQRASSEARAAAEAVIARHPECVPAHNLLARLDLEADRPEDAVSRLERTSLVTAALNPEALALLGAAHYVMDDQAAYKAVERRALAVNRKNAAFYAMIATHAERVHRYPESIELAEKGLRLAKDNADLLNLVAIGYSRSGNDKAARKALERAHREDPYHAKTFNLLTHFFDIVDKHFTWIDGDGFRIRANQSERAVLAIHVPPLVRETLNYFEHKYGVKAVQPLHIEIFESLKTFSMRSVGQPYIAAHGICFGHVITARSPSQSLFNWGDVLWHELAHVFHLQLSDNRVPRWFTEGLAMLESTEGRPAWAREMDKQFARAREAATPHGVRDFNLAFTQAKSVQDMVNAYFRAYHLARFIRDTFGPQSTTQMLKAWAARRNTAQVFEEVLKITPEAFDARFEAWLDGEFAWVDKAFPPDLDLSPPNPGLLIRQATTAGADAATKAKGAAGAWARKKHDQALALANEALALDPDEQTKTYATLVRGMALSVLGPPQDARAALLTVVSQQRGGVRALAVLAEVEERASNFRDAIAHLEAAITLEPTNVFLMGRLADIAVKAGDDALAISRWAKSLQNDETGYRLGVEALKLIAAKGGDQAMTKEIIEHMNFIRIFDATAQTWIARAAEKVGLDELAAKARKTLEAMPDDPDATPPP